MSDDFTAPSWSAVYVMTVLHEDGQQVDPSLASIPAMEVAAERGEGPFAKLIRPQEAREGDVLIVRKGAHVAYVEKVDDDGLHVAAGVPGGKVGRTIYRPGAVYRAIRVREPGRPPQR
jgi:hypothetical protein